MIEVLSGEKELALRSGFSSIYPRQRSLPFCVMRNDMQFVKTDPICQGLSYKERWHPEGMTERLDKSDANK